ncbi:hypothetical protein COOONC_12375 [Cooperia oncophora]
MFFFAVNCRKIREEKWEENKLCIWAELSIFQELNEVKESKVVAYDVSIAHRSRAKYLMNFISNDDCFTKIALDEAGNVVGIGCIRVAYSNDLDVGPFYADNRAVAETLLCGILSSIPDIKKHKILGSLYPAINTDAASVFTALGGGHAKIAPFTQCQFTKKIFPFAEDKVYAVIECANSVAVAETLLCGILSSIPDIKKHKILGSLYPAINTDAASVFTALGGGHAKIAPFTQCQFTKKIFPFAEDKVYAVIECANSVV